MLIYHWSICYEEDCNESLFPYQEEWICVACSPCPTLLGHITVSFGDIWRGKPVATSSHSSFDINELIKQYLNKYWLSTLTLWQSLCYNTSVNKICSLPLSNSQAVRKGRQENRQKYYKMIWALIKGGSRCFGNTQKEPWPALELGRGGGEFKEDFQRGDFDLIKQYVLLHDRIWRETVIQSGHQLSHGLPK